MAAVVHAHKAARIAVGLYIHIQRLAALHRRPGDIAQQPAGNHEALIRGHAHGARNGHVGKFDGAAVIGQHIAGQNAGAAFHQAVVAGFDIGVFNGQILHARFAIGAAFTNAAKKAGSILAVFFAHDQAGNLFVIAIQEAPEGGGGSSAAGLPGEHADGIPAMGAQIQIRLQAEISARIILPVAHILGQLGQLRRGFNQIGVRFRARAAGKGVRRVILPLCAGHSRRQRRGLRQAQGQHQRRSNPPKPLFHVFLSPCLRLLLPFFRKYKSPNIFIIFPFCRLSIIFCIKKRRSARPEKPFSSGRRSCRQQGMSS